MSILDVALDLADQAVLYLVHTASVVTGNDLKPQAHPVRQRLV